MHADPTSIDTRLVHAGGCECGHDAAYFDLIIGGQVHSSALVIHDDGETVGIYFEPDELRVVIETDPALHAAMHSALLLIFEGVAA